MSDEKRWGLINEMYGKFNSGQDLTKLDVTFGELDRDTQLRLVSHVLGGGVTENYVGDAWEVSGGRERKLLCFCNDRKYRALEATKNEN